MIRYAELYHRPEQSKKDQKNQMQKKAKQSRRPEKHRAESTAKDQKKQIKSTKREFMNKL